MDFKPTSGRLLVQPINSEQTVGGLFIPDTSTNLKKGLVIATADGNDIQQGETVYFMQDDTTPITLNEVHYLIMFERSVFVHK